ncbi:unnamed protein product [Closterium sp. Yama58-4]|nr:unnamed protein product [Closterium sp. Yama58-4]
MAITQLIEPQPLQTSRVALNDVKKSLLVALGKLNDRDTQQNAVGDLQNIVECLPPEGIPVFLSCLYETDSTHRTFVRKECLRQFAILAVTFGPLLSPHLPKIVAAVVRRLRDPESTLIESCAEAMATLVQHVPPPPHDTVPGAIPLGGFGAMGVYVRPLLDTLGEQSRNSQAGAAICLDRVFRAAREKMEPSAARVLMRANGMLSRQGFQAKAQLLGAVASLAEVCGESMGAQVPVLASAATAAVASADWATRKAAVDLLGQLAINLPAEFLGESRAAVMKALDQCKGDKVKNVRDSLAQAKQAWACVEWEDPPAAEQHQVLSVPSLSSESAATAVQAPSLSSAAAVGSASGRRASFSPAAADKERSIGGHSLKLQGRSSSLVTDPFQDTRETAEAEKTAVAISSISSTSSIKLSQAKPAEASKREASNADNGAGAKAVRPKFERQPLRGNPLFFKKAGAGGKAGGGDDWSVEVMVPKSKAGVVGEKGDSNPGEASGGKKGDGKGEGRQGAAAGAGAGAGAGAKESRAQADGVKARRHSTSGIAALKAAAAAGGRGKEGAGGGKGGGGSGSDWNVEILVPKTRGGWGKGGCEPEEKREVVSKADEEKSLEMSLEIKGTDCLGKADLQQEEGGGGMGGMGSNAGGIGSGSGAGGFVQAQPFMGAFGGVGAGMMGAEAAYMEDEYAAAAAAAVAEAAAAAIAAEAAGVASMQTKTPPHSSTVSSPRLPLVTSNKIDRQQQEQEQEQQQLLLQWRQDQTEQMNLPQMNLPQAQPEQQQQQLRAEALPTAGAAEGGGGRGGGGGGESEGAEAAAAEKPLGPLKRQVAPANWSWAVALDELKAGGFEGAYKEVLKAADAGAMVRLMGRTGPVLGHLSPDTGAEVIRRMVELLIRGTSVEYLLPWVRQLLDIVTDESSLPYGAEGPAVDGHLKQHVLAALQQVVSGDGGSWVGRSAGDYRRQLADAWGM